MPGRKCIICGKTNFISKKEGSYFSFPRDKNLRKKWIDVCHNKIDNIITARICSDHFKEEDFLHIKNGTEEFRKKCLKCNVVPSLYLEGKGGKQSQNSRSIENCNTENSKDFLKKKDSLRDSESTKDHNSVLQSKKKGTSGSKSIRDQIKKKSIAENNKNSNLLSKQKNVKGLNNKENTKELTRKNHLKNISPGIKEGSKDKKDQDSLKNKIKTLNTISIKKDLSRDKIAKKSINKENQMDIAEVKFSNQSNDSSKDISKEPKLSKSNNKELNKKKGHPEINSEDQNISITKNNSVFSKDKTSENKEKIPQEFSVTKEAGESNSENVDAIKKTMKRKSLLSNGMPRKVHKKRIRLGKDDSEDSEDSSPECRSINNVSRNKITYKSPSEMAANEDLLKYLNYLKEKSRSTDQPILFWADD